MKEAKLMPPPPPILLALPIKPMRVRSSALDA